MRQTESPGLFIVGRPVGNPVRMVWHRVQMFLQLRQGHFRTNRNAVVDDVKAGALEIDDLLTVGPFYVGIPHVPFFRYIPIKNWRPRSNFMEFEGNVFLNDAKRLTKAVAGDASAYRI